MLENRRLDQWEQLALITALQTLIKEHPDRVEKERAERLLHTISENAIHVRTDGLVGDNDHPPPSLESIEKLIKNGPYGLDAKGLLDFPNARLGNFRAPAPASSDICLYYEYIVPIRQQYGAWMTGESALMRRFWTNGDEDKLKVGNVEWMLGDGDDSGAAWKQGYYLHIWLRAWPEEEEKA